MFWLFKGGFRLISGTVEWYRSSYGSDFNTSEIASPVEPLERTERLESGGDAALLDTLRFRSMMSLSTNPTPPRLNAESLSDLGVSRNQGPLYRPQNNRALIMRTPEKSSNAPPNLRKQPFLLPSEPSLPGVWAPQ